MKKHKLLFLDDEENVLKSLKRLFLNSEYEILTASSAKDAVELLKNHDFSLILSDYRMPDMDGVEFLKIAKEKDPDTIRMILTGFADVSVAVAAINEGEVHKFIEKPWDGDDLKMQFKNALEFYELLKERKVLMQTISVQNQELKELNENLEKKVEKKTQELMNAHEALKVKFRELEGRDSILQFMLSINSLEEVLYKISEEIASIFKCDRIIMYVVDPMQKAMLPRAGMTIFNNKKSKIESQLSELPALPVVKLECVGDSEKFDESLQSRICDFSYIIPIEKDCECLGVILIDNFRTKRKLNSEELKSIAGFSSLASLAISEHLITDSLPNLQVQLNQLINDLK